jgi:hypothetical protein
MIGSWSLDAATAVFCLAGTQPTGKAMREIDALRAWLRRSETVEALMKEGLTDVAVIRKELITAKFMRTESVKATVK